MLHVFIFKKILYPYSILTLQPVIYPGYCNLGKILLWWDLDRWQGDTRVVRKYALLFTPKKIKKYNTKEKCNNVCNKKKKKKLQSGELVSWRGCWRLHYQWRVPEGYGRSWSGFQQAGKNSLYQCSSSTHLKRDRESIKYASELVLTQSVLFAPLNSEPASPRWLV